MAKIRWGVLSTAAIAREVVPALNEGRLGVVTAVASRDLMKARQLATTFKIAKAYGSYEELLEDPHVDAVYIPLPNALHVPWSLKAVKAGKHVLCEKPLGTSVEDVKALLAASTTHGVKVSEGFMFRHHPQWRRMRTLIDQAAVGTVRHITATFCYSNSDPTNIRNILDTGGGALLDVGCYLVHAARYLFSEEPIAVTATMHRDIRLRTDVLATILLEFSTGEALLSCGTQVAPYQIVHVLGSKARITLDRPFHAPPNDPTHLSTHPGDDFFGVESIERFEPVNQQTLQGDSFAKAVLDDVEPLVSIRDSLLNTIVLEAIQTSAESGRKVLISQ